MSMFPNYSCNYSNDQLVRILEQQILNFFPLEENEKFLLTDNIQSVIQKSYFCFQNIDNKYFQRGIFSPFHSGQWTIFLYFFSHKISSSNKTLADKIYYLNKIMNGLDVYHEVCLPDIVYLEHPLGSIFGRAQYGDFFTAMQGCTIGGNKNRQTGEILYPILGSHVTMLSNSKIIGKARIGNYVTLAANTYIKDMEIPDNATVFGVYPNITIKFL